jgi:hypothetical protein
MLTSTCRTISSLASFPRKRESIFVLAKERIMDFRFRGNDGSEVVQAFKQEVI